MHQYNDYNDMIESVKPDIVCIATRQTYHAEHIESAVKHGVRGLVCDKPLCTDLNESDRIIKVLRESETPFTFGLELRWSESYQAIFQMLREGIIGNVTSVVAHGVTELINHGCHFYDVALGMVGDPEPVSAIGIIDNPETFDDWRQGRSSWKRMDISRQWSEFRYYVRRRAKILYHNRFRWSDDSNERR